MGYEICPYCGGTNKGTTMHIVKYGAEDRWVADPCPYCSLGGIWKPDPPKPKAPARTSHFRSSPRKSKTPPLVQNKVKKYNGGKFLFQRHGRGAATHSDGLAYKGGWFFGKWKGKGVLTRNGAWSYEGRFGNGMLHGQGRLTLNDGTTFYGRFKRSEPKGQGKILFRDGARFEGKWLDVETAKGNFFWTRTIQARPPVSRTGSLLSKRVFLAESKKSVVFRLKKFSNDRNTEGGSGGGSERDPEFFEAAPDLSFQGPDGSIRPTLCRSMAPGSELTGGNNRSPVPLPCLSFRLRFQPYIHERGQQFAKPPDPAGKIAGVQRPFYSCFPRKM